MTMQQWLRYLTQGREGNAPDEEPVLLPSPVQRGAGGSTYS